MTSRQISSGTYTLRYDAKRRLVSISGGGMSAAYTYNWDGKGVKVAVASGSDTQITAYVGDYFEISVGDPRQLPTPTQPNCSTNYCVFFPLVMTSSLSIPAGHAWTSYFYVNGKRVAMRVKSNQDGLEDGVFYFLTDHLGSTAITLDPLGNVVGELRYSAWGETRSTSGTTPTQRRYTEQLQAEAGLYFYNARFYDSDLGRFVQADTIIPVPSNPMMWDRYAYVSNNSVNLSDPSGHMAWEGDGGDETAEELAYNQQRLEHLYCQAGNTIHCSYAELHPAETALFVGGGLVIAGLGGISAGGATIGSGINIGTTATAACSDGNCTNEIEASAALGQNIWNMNPFSRGLKIEELIGRSPNLVANFPIIDRFKNGIATSIKSINLGARSYQNLTTLTRTVAGYVNKLANWQGANWSDVRINSQMIQGRELILAISPNASQAQMVTITIVK